MSKVTSIETIDEPEYVYDPVCEAPHSYVGNGIVNHNCVVFLDELDKALGGMGSGGDSGTSSRVLGTLLTWMQDNKRPVFMVAAANDIRELPSPLLRKGRFDAIFSVGFPNAAERMQILNIHLNKRGWNADDFTDKDKRKVVDACNGYTPAEIEQSVKDALIDAYHDSNDLSMEYVAASLKGMVPLKTMNKDAVDAMTAWAKDHAIPASNPEEPMSGKVTSTQKRRRVRSKKPTTR